MRNDAEGAAKVHQVLFRVAIIHQVSETAEVVHRGGCCCGPRGLLVSRPRAAARVSTLPGLVPKLLGPVADLPTLLAHLVTLLLWLLLAPGLLVEGGHSLLLQLLIFLGAKAQPGVGSTMPVDGGLHQSEH